MLVIESIAGYYEAEEVAFGVVYKWCPERVVIECDCGERQAITGLRIICAKCGADHAYTIREELAALRLEDKNERPWRYERGCEEVVILF